MPRKATTQSIVDLPEVDAAAAAIAAYESAEASVHTTLTAAAEAVHAALAIKGITVRSLATTTSNKDTIARLDLVGQVLAIGTGEAAVPDEVTAAGSLAFAARTAVNAAIAAGAGVPAIRGAISTAPDGFTALTAIKAAGQAAKKAKADAAKAAKTAAAAAPSEGEGEGEGEGGDTPDTPTALSVALAAALAALKAVTGLPTTGGYTQSEADLVGAINEEVERITAPL